MASREVKVRITAQDDASAKVATFGQKLRLVRDQSEDAGRGLGRIGNLLGDMSREAIGATGPLGRLGEKLLEFGAGSGIFIALAGAVALTAKAIGAMTEGWTNAAAAYDAYLKTLSKQSPLAIVGAQLDALNEKVRVGIALSLAQGGNGNSLLVQRLTEQLAMVQAQYDALLAEGKSSARAEVAARATAKANQEAKAALERNLARQRAERLAAGGGGNVIGTAGAAPGDGSIPGILAGASPELKAQAQAAESAALAGQGLNESLSQTAGAAGQARKELFGVHEATFAIGEGLQALSGSLLGSIPGFGAVTKAASKAAGIIAKVEGTIAIAKGAVKIAESIFPFNPAGLASGTQMIATGTKLAQLGGGAGGGGGSRGGGGGLAPDTASRTQRELSAARAQRAGVTLRRGYIRTDDPDVQDFFRELTGANPRYVG